MTTERTPTSQPMPDATDEESAWQEQWQHIADQHFQEAHTRVDPIYRAQFASLRGIGARHWRNKRDIPKDLLNLPRSAWTLTRNLATRKKAAPKLAPTGKESEILSLIAEDLLQLPKLQQAFAEHLPKHPKFDQAALDELEQQLLTLKPEEVEQHLLLAVEWLKLSQEGGRDLLLFLAIGLAGRGVADKVTFGSAAALGSALASSVYIGQQSFIAGLWAGWFGAPAWVTAAGAASGLGLMVLATPLLSPLTELGINRLRGKKVLHKLIDQAEFQFSQPGFDLASTAGRLGTFAQLTPDVIQILKQLR